MNISTDQASELIAYAATDASIATTIIVGSLASWDAAGRSTQIDGFTFVNLSDLTAALLEKLAPALIMAPLVTEEFDAIDVATALAALGYKGRFRAIADDLPNVEMIRRDVRSSVPDIDFDVLALPPTTQD
ncbi:MAG: hypothetical protein AAFU41_13000 [Pseudomonadota bacterium]